MISSRRKSVLILITLASLMTILAVAWLYTSRSAYESAEYQVVFSDQSFEIREYPALKLITTDMNPSSEGGDGSFNRLYKYITGSNSADRSIAMTVPVFMEQASADQTQQMSFVLPKSVAGDKAPHPQNPDVHLTTRPEARYAVVRFSGSISDDVIQNQETLLRNWIAEQGLEPIGRVEWAAYDPPWTPGALRRNEVLIRVTESTS